MTWYRALLRKLKPHPAPVLKPVPGLPNLVEAEQLGFRWRLHLDRYLDRCLAEGQPLEAESLKLIHDLVKPGMVALDVGANFGYVTLQLARLVGPQGRVIAFEPTAEYAVRLAWHLEQNHVTNARLERCGLSDRNEELQIAIGECSATLHWSSDTQPRGMERIKLVRFDDWWDGQHPPLTALDFVKVDIDGHEPNFLAGAAGTLKRFRPLMLLEFAQANLYTNGWTVERLAGQLEQWGYELCSEHTGQPFASRLAMLKEAGNYAYSANVLARPRAGDGGRRE